MYDFPWLRRSTDRLWGAIAAGLRRRGVEGVPDALDRSRDLRAIWRDPMLLLAQTCGYPLVTELSDTVRVVATPCYAASGCDGAFHRSLVVVRADDPAPNIESLRGRRAAINGWDSNSGMNLLRALIAPLARDGRFFGKVVVTGAHLASVAAVRDGAADVAAIDCVTHALAARHRPELLEGTRVLAETTATPSLPLVAGRNAPDDEVDALRAALDELTADPASASLRDTLLIERFTVLPDAAYAMVVGLERKAAASGYPTLG